MQALSMTWKRQTWLGGGLLVPASGYSEARVAFARASRVYEAREATIAMGIEVTPLTDLIAERAAELQSARCPRAGHRT
jgi:hypothetical protein